MANGRDERGRFVKGHQLSIGNKGGRRRRAEEDEIKSALDSAMPIADAVARLAQAAQRGQHWAIKLWLAYRWGLPVERKEISGPGGEPVEHRIIVDYDQLARDFAALVAANTEACTEHN